MMTPTRSTLRKLLAPAVVVIAGIYFLIDAVFFWLLHPISKWIGTLPLSIKLARMVQSLGPYPTLILFAVPVILLEPVKPVGAYLIATHHATDGVALILVGELFKIAILERLFATSRDKLLTIPAFAWCYNLVVSILDYARSFEAWQAIARQVVKIKAMVRGLRWRHRGH